MSSLASFCFNGTEYQISKENLDMETLKALLKKVINSEGNPAVEKLLSPNNENVDWFEALLSNTNNYAGNEPQLCEADDEELLKSL
ncbi:hypothetical protein [Planctobacterium marinum]|uniref:Uncharacterized protein n=1 Tax=Planctobacterium marinum TaxID=1631968 RepID=A0AA48KT24_9ALTE|nr:hypothetical protein MACH26_26050 [Planctobacterium marinum]